MMTGTMARKIRTIRTLLAPVAVFALTLSVVVTASGCSHTVQIKSVPEGADVSIDGEKVGKTPYAFEAKSGFFDDHRVTVESEGYAPFETQIVQSEPIWPIVAPSVCLSPITLGLSCFGLCVGFRYAKAYEYELTPKVARGDGGLDGAGEFDDPKDEDPGHAIPY